MKDYKVVIIDDDQIAVDNIKHKLTDDKRFSLVGEAYSGKSGKELVLNQRPDLLFLDVEMPDMTGMEMLHELRDDITWNVKIVFYTAYDQYMIQAIRESAFDYLLKPFEALELQLILNRFIAYSNQYSGGGAKYEKMATPANQTFIIYTPTNDMRALRPAEIGFFRYSSVRKQWEVILHNQPPLALRRGTTAEQIIQYSSCFVQIHQSCIINIDYLMIIRDNQCMLYPPFDGASELMISKKFKRELQERFCL